MPNSRFALRSLALPEFTVCALFLPLIHSLCAFLGPLLTLVSTAPFFASVSVHGLHFTVYGHSIKSHAPDKGITSISEMSTNNLQSCHVFGQLWVGQLLAKWPIIFASL